MMNKEYAMYYPVHTCFSFLQNTWIPICYLPETIPTLLPLSLWFPFPHIQILASLSEHKNILFNVPLVFPLRIF